MIEHEGTRRKVTAQSTHVVVVGSANLDVLLRVSELPRPGETTLAVDQAFGAGGKGANQALAAARIGVSTTFIGAVGSDAGASVLRDVLIGSGVDVSLLRTVDAPTGTAYVLVEESGENCIVVVQGANGQLSGLTSQELSVIGGSTVLLCQLEVPMETVHAAFQHARDQGVKTILNAAPAQRLLPDLLAVVDVLVVNEHEALALIDGPEVAGDAVDVLLRSVPEVVVTLGADGALVGDRQAGVTRIPGFAARRVVDTTGAGDTFCGAFAALRARGQGLVDGSRGACAAASLAVERPGAGTAAPTMDEIMKRLEQQLG